MSWWDDLWAFISGEPTEAELEADRRRRAEEAKMQQYWAWVKEQADAGQAPDPAQYPFEMPYSGSIGPVVQNSDPATPVVKTVLLAGIAGAAIYFLAKK